MSESGSSQPSRRVSVQEALALARQALDRNPHEAKAICLRILEQAPKTQQLLELLAHIEERLGDIDEATAHLRKATQNPPLGLGARFQLIELLIRHDRREAALRELRKTRARAVAAILPNSAGQGRSWSAPLHCRTEDIRLANIAFSLGGEDLFLKKMLKEKLSARTPGFYVDIGCTDPIEGSNSYLFYCHGWRGICVDPISMFAHDYATIRPRDTFLNMAVTNMNGRVKFDYNPDNTRISRLASSSMARPKGTWEALSIDGRRLDSLLTEYLPAETAIDFMSIDVEGAWYGERIIRAVGHIRSYGGLIALAIVAPPGACAWACPSPPRRKAGAFTRARPRRLALCSIHGLMRGRKADRPANRTQRGFDADAADCRRGPPAAVCPGQGAPLEANPGRR